MKEECQLKFCIEGKRAQAILADGELWLSQSSLAKIFETSTQNINIHLAKLARHMDISSGSRCIVFVQREGARSVRRRLRHYNLEIAHAIGIRAQRFSELNTLIGVAERHNVSKPYYRIVPLHERDFVETLTLALKGITKVVRQFRIQNYWIDFYLPEYGLVIEYDESHHSKPLQRSRDVKRQREIKDLLGGTFIRVREGHELHGLNRILRCIISRKDRVTPGRASGGHT